MNPIAHRVERATGRSLLFALFGLLALMGASSTIERLAGPSVSGIAPFLVLLATALLVSYGAWYAREHRSAAPLLRHLASGHVSAIVIALVCVLSVAAGWLGAAAALGLAITALSLRTVRPHEALQEPRALLPDSVVALQVH